MNEFETALERLDPEALDFVLRLDDVMEVFSAIVEAERPFSTVFRFMEKHPGADFGVPGPIVHTLERHGGYEPALLESIRRAPIKHTLWMVNRILNSNLSARAREGWLGELRRVAAAPDVQMDVRAEALDYLHYQTKER